MSELVGDPEDRFSRNAAHIIKEMKGTKIIHFSSITNLFDKPSILAKISISDNKKINLKFWQSVPNNLKKIKHSDISLLVMFQNIGQQKILDL